MVVRAPGGGTVFAVTPDDYERLALSRAELLRYVREAKWRLDYYAGGSDAGE